MKHSPGPWTFDHEVGGCRIIRCNRPETELGGGDNEICCTPGLADDEEDFANASLIITAPAMLEVLKDIQDWIGTTSSPQTQSGFLRDMRSRINHVIAKAEGG